jgi:ubiquitin-activating enzyme E1
VQLTKWCIRTDKHTIIFNDCFWDNQNIIFSGVDKISARKYIDNKCTFYNKFFIDSGTQGTNAICYIYIPKETICLNDLNFSKKNEILSCILKNFTLYWSKSIFIELFE